MCASALAECEREPARGGESRALAFLALDTLLAQQTSAQGTRTKSAHTARCCRRAHDAEAACYLEGLHSLRREAWAHAIVRVWLQPAAAAFVNLVRQPAQHGPGEAPGAIEVATYSHSDVRYQDSAVIAIRHLHPAQSAAEQLRAARHLVEAQGLRRDAWCGLAWALARLSCLRRGAGAARPVAAACAQQRWKRCRSRSSV